MFKIILTTTYFMVTLPYKLAKYIFRKPVVVRVASLSPDSSLTLAGDIEKKMNSTTDDEAYASASTSSDSLVSTKYFSQISSHLNESTPSSILPIHSHELESEITATSLLAENSELRKEVSLKVEELYERLHGHVDLPNDYIQNIIKTSIYKYSIKKSIRSPTFKYFNEVRFCYQNNDMIFIMHTFIFMYSVDIYQCAHIFES